ncbi:porin [Magnetospirillum sulfuroxidans]|uniref:Porin n=1 Tax=Magnetospirillum sulfuroxidans TaxID=611300 RepID=A0ABS5IEB0_9PROT|nr:porin [Magnetospirillum sulfuroxidans]MBR9972761.1 porin [Magnetospirillum sulfuroxidans]
MKKILVASTALVAAGMITAGSASASEKIKLSLGGYSKWWVVGAWQDDNYEAAFGKGAGSANTVDVKGDNEIWFDGSTKLDNGLEVGVHMELEAGGQTDTNTSASAATSSDIIDKSYVYISGGFGKVIVGTESNGTVLMHTMAPDAAGNTGADGILTGGLAIARPANVTAKVTTEIDTDAEADKITYVSPTFYGFTVGGSYVPNVSEDNQNVYGSGGSTNSAAAEIYGVAAMYANTFGGLGVKASAGYVTYDVDVATDRSQELAFGTQLSYAGFTLGGSYRNIKQNLGATPGSFAGSDGYAWDIGLQYETGPYAVSVTYFNSVAEGTVAAGEDEFTVYQMSGKYNMGAGVDLLATVGHAEYADEGSAAIDNNEGWSVMTGLSLQF